ncbi:zf-TFIIB domain-containing protein [Alteromonas sp. AMM-1]|uniref:zf-TFIIB domain-containing protein n=1 Tax=Alteromonas sp. AMM-1 TaxID=3394233 RepID=UPI0039A5DA5C
MRIGINLFCPKCHGKFDHVQTPMGVIERCRSCGGLWFDVLEHADHKVIAKAIDTGDKELGALYNDTRDIHCPVCVNTRMLKMTDSAQTHIQFESCPGCHGRFYDAGEFADFAQLTISDVLKRVGILKK